MGKLTNQEIFDRVVRFMIKQGKAAVSEEGLCEYLTEDGLRCGIGCLFKTDPETNAKARLLHGPVIDLWLIPDDHHQSDREKASIGDFLDFEVGSERQLVFLRALQRAHDMANALGMPFERGFTNEANEIARDWRLDATVLKEAQTPPTTPPTPRIPRSEKSGVNPPAFP